MCNRCTTNVLDQTHLLPDISEAMLNQSVVPDKRTNDVLPMRSNSFHWCKQDDKIPQGLSGNIDQCSPYILPNGSGIETTKVIDNVPLVRSTTS
jgi:hypothetical protein